MSAQNIEMIELGCLMVMCAYHVILFFQIRRNYYLYLGLLCLIVLIRASLVGDGSQLFYQVFNASRTTGIKIEFLAAYSSVLLMPLFIHDLYTFRSFTKYVNGFQIVGGLLMLFVIFTPYKIYYHSLNVYHLVMVADFIFVFVILYFAMKKGRTGAKAVFYGLAVCFGFVFLEMMKNSGLLNLEIAGPNLVNTGVVAYLFFQSIALSTIFARSFHDNQKLAMELEEKVSARTEQLTKSNLVKDRFIQIVSHDLRSPLSSIRSTIDLAGSDALSDKEAIDIMTKVNDQVTQSLNMLDDLLNWSKVSVSKMKMEKEPVHLGSMIRECINIYEEIALKKEIDLHFEQTSPAILNSDRNALKVVFRNLISNAIKFTPRGGTILVTVGKMNNNLNVVVSDTGIGLSAEMKESLFEMNRKNCRPGTENEESTGIGLALCNDLVIQNNGTITVESNPAGKGTIFTVSFKVN